VAAILLLTLVSAACGASDPGWPPQQTNFALTPVPVSTEIVVGPNRLLFNILDKQNQSIASADRPVNLRFFDMAANKTQPAMEAPGTFMSTIEGRPGLYRAAVDFSKAGDWGVEAVATEPDGSTRMGRMVFSVRETGTTPPIGAQGIPSDTPTASTPDEIATISTDDNPDPDFYRESVADALAAHEPFALVFATPAFCTSATCGPTLDMVKSAAANFKGRMSFIHVEPYELQMVDGHLQPVLTADNLPISVQATEEWGLPTEPYIFVLDSDGKVTAKFEGIASPEELQAAFESVAKPPS
jgi:YtkA-like